MGLYRAAAPDFGAHAGVAFAVAHSERASIQATKMKN